MKLLVYSEAMFVKFRTIFNKLPDKEKHEEALLGMSDEWMEV